MDEQLAVRCRVTGLVQGVFYRAGTRQEALRLGVRGWVRNLEDGSVEVVASGSRAAVEALCAWLWRGPPRARVSHVERLPCGDAPSPSGSFEIR